MAESALVIRVPEAEPYVAQLREQFDPSARLGMPAHVTVLYPFMPLERISGDVLQQVRSLVSAFGALEFVLAQVRRFAGTLYLAPEPASSFVAFTMGLVRAFPAYQPYGGQHDSVVPHLTVARADESELGPIESELSAALPPQGIDAHCRELVLVENSSGRWLPFHSFSLAVNRMQE